MDDILVSPPTEEAHLAALDQVMARLEKHGLRRKLAKCSFLENSEHVEHGTYEHGFHPMEDKVEAISNAEEFFWPTFRHYCFLCTSFCKQTPNGIRHYVVKRHSKPVSWTLTLSERKYAQIEKVLSMFFLV